MFDQQNWSIKDIQLYMLHIHVGLHLSLVTVLDQHTYVYIKLCQLYLYVYVHWNLHAAASKILTDEILPVNFLCMRKLF